MPECYIIFTGRPNAGKSTTIRALTGVKVPVGKRPGTTRKINKYQISKDLYLVDMPGYGRKLGAHKNSEERTKDQILKFIEKQAENIMAAVHVLNINTFIETEARLAKKGFISIDVEMVKYIAENLGTFPFVAANKIDKGSEREIMENMDAFLYGVTDGDPEAAIDYVFPVSSKKKIGLGQLKSRLVQTLSEKGYQNPFSDIRNRKMNYRK
ncbi:GTP-binding protein [Candidatus Bathyarchaeota archaeon]|jgi:GTP-binding protein EngB required for normal cell division|nr:GTP-binding protein [Candidatus Bathyarchaeota archaeon]MBT4320801.1 GTP-binding protein [Candidatus Bathyarchaeota archaeon]MBT4423075.1 GTP-binding protein [Candidatus Bathyarchaeota archaeon]MBT5642470.1 GTP-binding protein [Candidatus Bathyarchaeota archaeon]MBT6605458.1 GTP-binding protein [Candidatus Bathyarchaeota archaeon]